MRSNPLKFTIPSTVKVQYYVHTRTHISKAYVCQSTFSHGKAHEDKGRPFQMRSIVEPRFIRDASVRVRICCNRGWPSASGLLTSATVLVSLVSAKPAFAEPAASTPAAARPAAAEPAAKVGGISEGGRACLPSRMRFSFRSRC